jgi:hypothetical protein
MSNLSLEARCRPASDRPAFTKIPHANQNKEVILISHQTTGQDHEDLSGVDIQWLNVGEAIQFLSLDIPDVEVMKDSEVDG